MFKLENIYKHLHTSGLAVVILILTSLFVWFDKATMTEVWPAWIAVLGFFFYGKPPKQGAALMILLLIGFVSCTPQKRIQRIIKHHPEVVHTIYDTVHFDTTIVHTYDTTAQNITIKQIDTLAIHDTITIQGQHNTVYLYRTHTDTLRVKVITPPDTVFISKNILTQHKNIQIRQRAPNEFKNFLIYGILFLGALLVLFVVIKAYQK
jgi:hypothetical protein